MKIIPLMLSLLLGITVIYSAEGLADDSNNYTLTEPVVGLDSNREGQITAKDILDGDDSFIVREAKPNDTRVNGSFTGINGKTYIPLTSLEQLRVLDLNKDGIVSNEEMQASKIKMMTARILSGTSKVIIERPIWESLMSIQFPAKMGDAISAKVNDQDTILIEVVK